VRHRSLTIAAALAASTFGAATSAQAASLAQNCINGPLYRPYFSDRFLINEAFVNCGVFGNVPHTVKIELTGPNGFYTSQEGTWFPGQYRWRIGHTVYGVNWGTPERPTRWNSCVITLPYDNASWAKVCIAAKTYRRSATSYSIVREEPVYSHQFK